jgi:hypothetical protein
VDKDLWYLLPRKRIQEERLSELNDEGYKRQCNVWAKISESG